MKISEHLPQFSTERALLIVTGNFHAHIYEAYDGVFTEIDSIEIERPAYSDREEHFETRTHGKLVTAGAAYEDTEDHDRARFFNVFGKALISLFRSYTADLIFLFSPEYNAPEALKSIPDHEQDKVKGVFKGNYSDKHPFELLTMISKLEKTRVPEPKSEEAQKIYEKTSKYRNT